MVEYLVVVVVCGVVIFVVVDSEAFDVVVVTLTVEYVDVVVLAEEEEEVVVDGSVVVGWTEGGFGSSELGFKFGSRNSIFAIFWVRRNHFILMPMKTERGPT